MPLIDGTKSSLRDADLIEAYSLLHYNALRTSKWKYIHWESGHLELYDLSYDPYELVNLAPYYPDVVQDLQSQLDRMVKL
jgi:hypothetical protein